METKICSQCKIEKSIDEFHKHQGKHHPKCKACRKQYTDAYYIKNREKILSLNAEYRKDWKNKNPNYMREYYQKNKKHIIKKSKMWILNNLDKVNSPEQKHRRKLYKKNYDRWKYKNDPTFRLIHSLRSRLNQLLKGLNKSSHLLDMIGLSPSEFFAYLENQFEENMSWDNYGKNGWTIDHKIPCASFDHSNPEEIKKCWHYTNLQPMWYKDNIKKGNKIF